jgi:carboxymethylenebutenolidase
VPGEAINIRSSEGSEFACYLATPESEERVPAVVLASSVRGVDADIRAIADEFATHGFIAAAPDLFWRSPPGPDASRLAEIRTGESDMADTLGYLGTLAMYNGRAAAMGFCYGGPYAILGPKRLGYAAGISCHGTRMLDFIKDLDGIVQPVCILWGDQDSYAPTEVLDTYRDVPSRMRNVEVHVFPGVLHGYMMRGSPRAFEPAARDFSMARAKTILEDLGPGRLPQ